MQVAIPVREYVAQRLAQAGIPELALKDLEPGLFTNFEITEIFQGNLEDLETALELVLKKPEEQRRKALSDIAVKQASSS